MALVNRGRLSVQPLEERTYNIICSLAEKGGWTEGAPESKKAPKTSTTSKKRGPSGGKAKAEVTKAAEQPVVKAEKKGLFSWFKKAA